VKAVVDVTSEVEASLVEDTTVDETGSVDAVLVEDTVLEVGSVVADVVKISPHVQYPTGQTELFTPSVQRPSHHS